jgi:plasmid segregation protein ParM
MDTRQFKTRSEIIEKKMPRISGNNQYRGKTVIALDGGYSAVKGVSPDRIFIFPSYAKRVDAELESLGVVRSFDIQYRNNATGEIWLVGQSAFAMMTKADMDSTTDASLYSRYRYDSEVYRVIMGTGLALGCIGAQDNEIYLQTGLPAKYKDADEGRITNALAGDYDISLKLGAREWMDFKFSLPKDHIFVMEQPQGTLCACAYNADGISPLGKDILTSSSLILDIGFGTEDTFAVRKGYNEHNERTYTDTAMKSVFGETLHQLAMDGHPVENKIFELQNHLDDGVIPSIDPDTFHVENTPFGDVLETKNKELCEKGIRRLMQEYDNLVDYRYLIVTGGTGECRFEQIKNRLAGLTTLTVLPGNMNYPELSFAYSNVIGYYMYRHAVLAKQMRAQTAPQESA